MKWWMRIFRVRQPDREFMPVACDMETGEICVWNGNRMVPTGVILGAVVPPWRR